jgi:hypothetical protein
MLGDDLEPRNRLRRAALHEFGDPIGDKIDHLVELEAVAF